jgi:NAD(P)-dependent dehydrogenase (short-subunit alcohol dehydrogenase family)
LECRRDINIPPLTSNGKWEDGISWGVTVNAVAPGIADTPMTQTRDFVYNPNEVPLGRAARPEEVAQAVLFLASEASGYITGQCINVNGGMYFG